MVLYEQLISKNEKLALVGLGYVGMPIAVAFANKGIDVIGFDLNKAKIELYKNGIDPTKEVGDEAIKNTTVYFTDDEKDLQNVKLIRWHYILFRVADENSAFISALYTAGNLFWGIFKKIYYVRREER